ncbi:histidine kinase [Acetobacter orleanensis]|nr:histidine kinase [Acetobacter orleanensis]
MANLSALIFEALPDLNWAGFYLYRADASALATIFTLTGSTVPSGQPVTAQRLTEAQSDALLVASTRGELVLGPFQGRVACTRIAMGKGVCGTAALSRATQRVPDVHAFPGHIACDTASASEIVIPLVLSGRLLGVLDLDSPRKDRFSSADQHLLETLVAAFLATLPVSA